MNQAPTSLEVVGAPPPNWVEEFPNPSDSQSIHTPQGPAEDAPKNWNYQKIKWYLKKFFFFFTNGFQRPAGVSKVGRGN